MSLIKKYNLFLDDVRNPKGTFEYTKNDHYINDEWSIVRSYNEFVQFITENGLPDMISFDHDLADPHYHESMYEGNDVYMKYLETVSEKTGLDCTKWLVNYCMDNNLPFPEKWFVHSMNPVGAKYITSYILSYQKSLTIDTEPTECPCGGSCKCSN